MAGPSVGESEAVTSTTVATEELPPYALVQALNKHLTELEHIC
jgi:hypothetical protein